MPSDKERDGLVTEHDPPPRSVLLYKAIIRSKTRSDAL